MIKAEVTIQEFDGVEKPTPSTLTLTNSDDRFVWVCVHKTNFGGQAVRVDINHLEQAIRAIKAGKD